MKHTKIVSALILFVICISAFMLSVPTSHAAAAYESNSSIQPAPQPTPPGGQPQPSGPDNFPPGVNPLTGLPVQDPASLLMPPALISITNFPISARPQAGLSFSPVVFEMYVGDGDSRFLALFYGDYPSEATAGGTGISSETYKPATIGPIRSGRLPYESLRKLYNGFLVMASAYKTVAANLNDVTNIFGSDGDDVNSAMIDIAKLAKIAKASQDKLGVQAFSGQKFDPAVPQGGKAAKTIWLPYSYLNQIFWRYDAASGAYQRYNDNADGTTFSLQTDRLNGEPLAYENVVILFATHHVYAKTLIDIDLMYIDKMPALLFRDGKMYEIFWTTKNDTYEKTTGKVRPIRFIDAQGNPFPLKPGQTWINLVPPFTPYVEVADSEAYNQLKSNKQPGSGVWAIHFYVPPIEPQP